MNLWTDSNISDFCSRERVGRVTMLYSPEILIDGFVIAEDVCALDTIVTVGIVIFFVTTVNDPPLEPSFPITLNANSTDCFI